MHLLKTITKLKPENIFLLLALIFGISMVFVTPPLQSPDEDSHFLSILRFSSFRTNPYFSSNEIAFVQMHHYIYFKPDQKYSLDKFQEALAFEVKDEDASQNNNIYYKLRLKTIPWYLPSIAGMSISKLFSDNFCLNMWAGRLANLFAFAIILFYAIRITPYFKWGFVLLGLMPMTLFLASSLSYDSFTTAISYLLIALILKMFAVKHKLDFKNNWLVILIISIMVFLKFPYLLLATPILFLKKDKFKGSYCYIIKIMVVFAFIFQLGIQMLPNATPAKASSKITYYDRSFGSDNPLSDQKPKDIKSVIVKPGVFVHEFFNTLTNRKKILLYIGSFAGCLGWLDTLLPPSVLIFFYLVLMFTSLTVIQKVRLNGFEKSIFFLTGTGLFVAIHFIFYVLTKEETTYIDGIQGRYFIPFAPYLLLPFLGIIKLKKIRKKRLFMNLLFCGSILFVQIVSMTTLLQRYYFSYWWERNL
jgi:uncharacterized membrane protein